jgi:mannose-6-phosphate isomerase-like protein (cupin superfamily)
MSIPSGEEIGFEKHTNTTQFIRIESGKGIAIVSGKKYLLKDGDAIIIPPNTKHNIIATSNDPLKLYTIYSPPEHPKNLKTNEKE